MYIPQIFENQDRDKLFDFIEQWSFGELVTTFDKELFINHMPFIIDKVENKIYGHLAIKNPQISLLEKADELIAVFRGADCYISPNWYVSEKMVPTWNFEAVHVSGKATLIYDEGLLAILEKLTEKHERHFEKPWTIDKISKPRISAMMKVIVGFEIEILSIKGKSKLSQNRSIEDRVGVISGLKSQHNTMSHIIAEKMESNFS